MVQNRGWIFSCCMSLILLSCQNGEERLRGDVDRARLEESDPYSKVYVYAAYLSTSREVEAAEAIPLINEMISAGYPLEARYSINNLMNHGISSWDLLALRGLCYLNESHPDLARIDLENALKGDPGNRKIEMLLDQAEGGRNRERILKGMLDEAMTLISDKQSDAADSMLNVVLHMDPLSDQALFTKALIRIESEKYDSALYYLSFANSIENSELYERYINRMNRAVEGSNLIRTDPDSFRGYLILSEALSGIGEFGQAQRVLDRGLVRQPDHLNLILAKALVWVQSGARETARQYLREQQERGVPIDPEVVNQIMQNNP